MNLVKLIMIISAISFCFSLEVNNRSGDSEISIIQRQKRGEIKWNKDKVKLQLDLTNIILPKIAEHRSNKIDGSILLRKRRMQPSVSKNQNNVKNDNIKIRLDLNNFIPKITQQRPKVVQQPITNIRVRPRPLVLANNKINTFNKGASKQNVYHPVKTITATKPAPAKTNNETKPILSPTDNITKSTPDPTQVKFYLETNDQGDKDVKLDSVTPKPPLETRVKETVLTKLREECSDNKKDKNDVIIGLMKELPDIIKTVLNERIKDGNPIIFKNITEITLPIQRGEITNNQVINKNATREKQQVQEKNLPNDEAGKADIKTNIKHSQEVMDLLLKPILKAKENKVCHSPLQVSSTNNLENDVESIEIKQNNYSEIVERKHEPNVMKLEDKKEPVEEKPPVKTHTKSLSENQNPIANFPPTAYNTDSTYRIPKVQDTTFANPNVYNGPLFTTSANNIDVFPNLYTPNALYVISPYEYSQLPLCLNLNSIPKYNFAADNNTNNIEPYGSDDTKWKTWSNTEILIKTNNNNAGLQNQRPMLMQNQGYPKFNGNSNNCYQNQFMPMYSSYPCYVLPSI